MADYVQLRLNLKPWEAEMLDKAVEITRRNLPPGARLNRSSIAMAFIIRSAGSIVSRDAERGAAEKLEVTP